MSRWTLRSMARIMYFCVFLALVIAGFAVTPAVAAQQRYASPTGTGPAASCPEVNPCSIVSAVKEPATKNGDEVILAPGTYTNVPELDITVAADIHGLGSPAQTRIESTNNIGIYLDNVGAKLRNVEISHNIGIGAAAWVQNGTLDRVIARSTNGNGCTAVAATIRDSVCASSRSGGAGLNIYAGSGVCTTVLRNVTAVDTGLTNSQGILAEAATGATLLVDAKSVIARGTPRDIWAIGAANVTVTLDHSNFKTVLAPGGASVTLPSVNSNQSTPPVFVNAAANDFHQAAGSLTIDAGALDGSSGTTDVDGDTRSLGAAADIGADEFVATVAAPVILTPANGSATTDTTPTISGTAEANTTVAVYANISPIGTTTVDNSGNWSLSTSPALADGAFAITATATNANNVTSPASPAINLTVDTAQHPSGAGLIAALIADTTAPQTTIGKGLKSKTSSRKAKIRFTSSEVNSAFKCKLDKRAFAPCTSPFVKRVKLGKHILQVVATDTAGNSDPTPAVFKWRVRAH